MRLALCYPRLVAAAHVYAFQSLHGDGAQEYLGQGIAPVARIWTTLFMLDQIWSSESVHCSPYRDVLKQCNLNSPCLRFGRALCNLAVAGPESKEERSVDCGAAPDGRLRERSIGSVGS